MEYTVSITDSPARHLLVMRFRASAISDIPRGMGEAFGAVMQYAGMHGIEVQGPAVGHYTRTEDGFDVAAGFAVPHPVAGEGDIVGMSLPTVQAATVTHVGPYGELTSAYQALVDWADTEDRLLDQRVTWEEYWSGPEVPEAEHKTVVYWPLQPISVSVPS